MSYKVHLTPGNIKSLEWAERHGYFPEGWCSELESPDSSSDYLVSESMAWELVQFRDEDEDAFLSCMPPDVVEAVWGLLESVV